MATSRPALPSILAAYVDDQGRPKQEFGYFLQRLIAWVQDVNSPILNVKDYGAVGNGVADDTAAILAADAAALALGTRLYFPAGTYLVDSLAASTPRWFGDGPEATTIKIASSSSTADGVTVGAPTGTSQYNAPSLEGLTIDANGKCSTGAALLIRNVARGRFSNLMIKNSAGHGLRSDTAKVGVGGNTYTSYNQYHHIRVENCTLDGFHWTGEHFSDFQSLISLTNRDGFVWENFAPDDAANAAANEECTGSGLHAINCTRDSFRFDCAEKIALGQLISTGALRYGMSFWFDTNPTGTNGNAVKVAVYSSRNDRLGGIFVDPTDGGLVSAMFGEVSVVGFASTAGSVGVVLAAAQNVKFGSLYIAAWPGIGMSLQSGSPKSGATAQSSNIQIGNLAIVDCGSALHLSHGLMLQDSTANVQIANLQMANAETTGSNYEIDCGSTSGSLQVGSALVVAAAGGNEESQPGRIDYAQKNF